MMRLFVRNLVWRWREWRAAAADTTGWPLKRLR